MIASRRQRKLRKRWIDRARKAASRGEKEPCIICGLHTEVCHAHHVAPLQMQYDIGMRVANQDCVWLCPTHHSLVHSAIKAALDGKAVGDGDEAVQTIVSRGLAILVSGALSQVTR